MSQLTYLKANKYTIKGVIADNKNLTIWQYIM